MNSLFNPKAIALIGATDRKGSVGFGISKNLLEGKARRKIFFVNPYQKTVLKRKTYPSILSIKEKIDLAIIAIPSNVILETVKEVAKKKVNWAIIISSGFSETGKEGSELQKKVAAILKKAKVGLIGPNCLGIIRPSSKMNASFAPAMPKSGGIGFISQSGALIDSVVDQSLFEGYGFSSLISYGNGADLNICDFLKILEKDKETKSIALYLESIKEGRKFIEIAKKVNKKKPIVVLKGGKTMVGRKAASLHTASLAGNEKIYSAAFKQAGIFQVNTISELLAVSLGLSMAKSCAKGKSIAIITNGGAAGVIAADWAEKLKLFLAPLDKKTIKKLKSSKVFSKSTNFSNPLDIIGDALTIRYKKAIDILMQQKNIYGIIVIQTLQIMTDVKKNAETISALARKYKEKPIICCFMGGKLTLPGIEILRKNNIPNYNDPYLAVLAMKALIRKK